MNYPSKLSVIILIGVVSILLMPAVVSAQGLVPCGQTVCVTPTTCSVPNPCRICHFFVLTDNVIDFVLFQVTLPLAVIFIIYGGILMVTAAGSEPQIVKGKNFLKWTVMGMVIAFAAWIIINLIISTLVPAGFNFTFGGSWFSYSCP